MLPTHPNLPPLPKETSTANDNAWEPPVVTFPRKKPESAYARSENIYLPLRFARRFPEWSLEHPEMRPLERVWRSRAARTARIFNRLFSK
jgi:hypothetical protein